MAAGYYADRYSPGTAPLGHSLPPRRGTDCVGGVARKFEARPSSDLDGRRQRTAWRLTRRGIRDRVGFVGGNVMKITSYQATILRIPEDDPLANMPEETGRMRPVVILRLRTDN